MSTQPPSEPSTSGARGEVDGSVEQTPTVGAGPTSVPAPLFERVRDFLLGHPETEDVDGGAERGR